MLQVWFVVVTVAVGRLWSVHAPVASFGTGPLLWQKTVGGTDLQLRGVPLSSYVQHRGEIPDGLRSLEQAGPWVGAVVRLAPWGLAWGAMWVADPTGAGSVPWAWRTWLVGAAQPLSTGAEAVAAAWALVREGGVAQVAAATAAAMVAANLLPWPSLAAGGAMLGFVGEGPWVDRLRLGGGLLSVGWALAWLVALGGWALSPSLG